MACAAARALCQLRVDQAEESRAVIVVDLTTMTQLMQMQQTGAAPQAFACHVTMWLLRQKRYRGAATAAGDADVLFKRNLQWPVAMPQQLAVAVLSSNSLLCRGFKFVLTD